MTDEAPSWFNIGCALTSVLSKFDNIEIESTIHSKTIRLEYKFFETLIYHLFLIINSRDCKKTFKAIYPARDRQEQNRFMDSTAMFINDRKLYPSKITKTQLWMLGGEPFRRLLGQIIVKAMNTENNLSLTKLPDVQGRAQMLSELIPLPDIRPIVWPNFNN